MNAESIRSPRTSAILKTLQYQGQRNDCGPYTAAMVINVLRNTRLNAHALAEKTNKPRRKGILPIIRRIPHWATFP